jgi:flagellar biosynthesis regulator FlaF|tara:strand:- start:272 stop:628 length:357 start_codon:yes stop_codon:yes gene_type:complete
MAEAQTGGNLSLAEEQAFQLSRCAIALDQARQNRAKEPEELTNALNENLQVWVAIRSFAMREDSGFSDEIKENLTKLSKFVAEKTFDSPEGISEQTMDTLINVNLQISEGLLEGVRAS